MINILEIQYQTVFYPGFSKRNITSVQAPVLEKKNSTCRHYIYITSIILVLVITITMAFGEYVNVSGGAFALGISTASTIVLGFLFIPKVSDYFAAIVIIAKWVGQLNLHQVATCTWQSEGEHNHLHKTGLTPQFVAAA